VLLVPIAAGAYVSSVVGVLIKNRGIAVCNPDWLLTILDVGILAENGGCGRGSAWASAESVR
jgi:hypothetical protein